MDDGLIFPYRWSTAHADVRVLTHAVAAVSRGWAFGPGCRGGGVVWGPTVLVGKRVLTGVTHRGSLAGLMACPVQACGLVPR